MLDKSEKIFLQPDAERDRKIGTFDDRANFEIKKESAILADRGNGNLVENIRIFGVLKGIKIYAATDRGLGNEDNNDRVIINADSARFSVLDGMLSADASQILAKKILVNPDNLEKALDEAKSEMMARHVNDGACLVSAELTPGNILRVSQIGDCGALVLDPSGKIKFSATQQVRFRSTALEVNMKELGIKQTSQMLIETSPRSFVSGSSGDLYSYDDFQLTKGDTTLLFSDVIWSNFSMSEISQFIKQNKAPRDLFEKIAEELRRKMQSANNIFSSKGDDVFPSFKERTQCYYGGDYVPNSDNQSLILFQV